MNFDLIKQSADGRCIEIITSLTPISKSALKAKKDAACPLCGHDSLHPVRTGRGVNRHGRVRCHRCNGGKATGDVIATVAMFNITTQSAAARLVADYLGIDGGTPRTALTESELLKQICGQKHIVVEHFLRYRPRLSKRNAIPGFDVPMVDATGTEVGKFFISPNDKGKVRRGSKHGLFVADAKLPIAGDLVLVVEGFKDAAKLLELGFNAVGLPTNQMNVAFAEAFRDCHVVIVPDLDDAGFNGANRTASRLIGIARTVRVARLPGELKTKGGDDVRDIAERGGGRDLIRNAVEEAKPWTPGDNAKSWLLISNNHQHNQLAKRFIDEHGANLRYVAKWDSWLVWDGNRWKIDARSRQVLGTARRFADSLWSEVGVAAKHADRGELPKIQTFVRRANDEHALRAFINLASADSRTLIDHERLNADPYLFNCTNGTYDLSSGEFHPHRRDDLITQVANVTYDAEACCPKWRKFIELIFEGDADQIRYVAQILGYSLTGDTGEHILPIGFGTGANGKSTLWNTIIDLAGDYGTLALESLLLGRREEHRTEVAHLYQKRIVAISEPERNAVLKESRVKELTGDAFITARRMREDPWTFRRTHTFWLSTNHLPRIGGTDDGIWRRVKVIPFPVDLRRVAGLRPIKDYHKELCKTEGAGILNWCIDGYRSYAAAGEFSEPAMVADFVREYRSNEDHIGKFISECCVLDIEAHAQAQTLFEAYREWGGRWSNTAFGKSMSERYEKKQVTSGPQKGRLAYHGIGLSSQ